MHTPKEKRTVICAGLLAVVVLGVSIWLSWPHLRFWYLFEPLGVNAQGFMEYRHRETGIVMVRLPGGKFWMGAQAKDPNGRNYDPEGQDNEGPVHQVTLGPFLISKNCMTVGQWKAGFQGRPPPLEMHLSDDSPFDVEFPQQIVEFTKSTSLSAPTDEQWEYASREGAVDEAEIRESADGKMLNRFGISDHSDTNGHISRASGLRAAFYPLP